MTMTSPGGKYGPVAGLPLPEPGWDNHTFWDYCKQHKLYLQRCATCRNYWYYPRPLCPVDQSREMVWTEMSGKGTVWTYTIAHHPVLPAFAKDVPLPVGVIKLKEGEVYMVGRLIDVKPGDVRIGMPVEVTWFDASADISLPYWKPAAS
jgi:uncharacterized OB-fold protein